MYATSRERFGAVLFNNIIEKDASLMDMFPSATRSAMGFKFVEMLNVMVSCLDDLAVLLSKLRQLAPMHVSICACMYVCMCLYMDDLAVLLSKLRQLAHMHANICACMYGWMDR